MKIVPRFALAFGVLALALFVSGRAAAPQSTISDAPIHVRPFTLVQKTYNFEENPEGDLISVQTIERREDGAIASSTDGHPLRKIVYPNGVTEILYDSVQMLVHWVDPNPRQAAFVRRQQVDPGDCYVHPQPGAKQVKGQDPFLGYEKIGEFTTTKIQFLIADSDSVFLNWFSPDLGCQPLKSQFLEDGKKISEMVTTEITLDTYDATLFAVPSTYQSVTPSVALKAQTAKLGVPWNENLQRQADYQDQQYQRSASTRSP